VWNKWQRQTDRQTDSGNSKQSAANDNNNHRSFDNGEIVRSNEEVLVEATQWPWSDLGRCARTTSLVHPWYDKFVEQTGANHEPHSMITIIDVHRDTGSRDANSRSWGSYPMILLRRPYRRQSLRDSSPCCRAQQEHLTQTRTPRRLADRCNAPFGYSGAPPRLKNWGVILPRPSSLSSTPFPLFPFLGAHTDEWFIFTETKCTKMYVTFSF